MLVLIEIASPTVAWPRSASATSSPPWGPQPSPVRPGRHRRRPSARQACELQVRADSAINGHVVLQSLALAARCVALAAAGTPAEHPSSKGPLS